MTSPALRDAMEALRHWADAIESDTEGLFTRRFEQDDAEEEYRKRAALLRFTAAILSSANSSDVSVPREAWELWRAECQKPQFFTQSSGGGKASVEFTYHGEGALKRAQAMHSALTAIALAAGSASPA